ncbi:MAG: PBP1A family penicillin-binding protein [Coriobacteriia bacterium]|nr:PBP1A family penicillin-binding protein [Coriobacteriia bacterium]
MSRHSRIRRKKPVRVIPIIAAVIAFAMIGTVFAGGAAAAAAVGVADSWLDDLPSMDDADAFEVAQATKIYSADGILLANLYLENRQVVTIDQISPDLLNAVVAVEDERFYEHNGVDYLGIARAFVTNLTSSRREGASTLTQQYIRNTILAEERYDISYRRKAREAWLALELERKYDKEDILAMYINTVYYGEGAHGAEAAALTYFNKHASELTIAEAALIAGLPQSPVKLSPYDNPDGAVSRRQWVLAKMFEQNYITSEEYEAAKTEALTLKRSPTLDEDGVYAAPYFVAHVKKVLQDQYGTDVVFKGGLTVHTTLDTRLQTYAEDAVRGVLDRPEDPDCALVAVDPRTGYIKAMVGGRDWENNKFNFATQARRQPGSSFKVFTLVTALEAGMNPDRRQIDSSSPAIIQTGGTPWRVGNAEGGGGRGFITLRQATVGSVNTAFARLIAEMGAEKVVETAHRMGVTSDLDPVLSITLGSQEVTPLEMASAFGTLAADGKHYAHTPITKIVGPQGETLYEATPQGEQAITHSIAYATTQVLKGVVSGGTATRARIGRPAAGKTGTTQDYRDAWFVGYTPQLSCSVWMGYTPERPMRNVHGRKVFGGTFPAPIWHDFMIKALEGEPVMDFNPASAPPYTWKKDWEVPAETGVPKLAGMTQDAAIAALKSASYEYTIATAFSDTVPVGQVIAQTPAAGTKSDPETVIVTVVISSGPDPSKPAPNTPEPPKPTTPTPKPDPVPDPDPEPGPDPGTDPTSTPSP